MKIFYSCNNSTCSIHTSKANFPEKTHCPLCQNELVETLSISVKSNTIDIDTKIKDIKNHGNIPFVIGIPLNKAEENELYWLKLNYLKDALLNYLKYLGLITVSEFLFSNNNNPHIVKIFQQALSEPSFGKWNHFIRETIALLKLNNHRFFCSELPDYYDSIEISGNRKIYSVPNNIGLETNYNKVDMVKGSAISLLINFRNKYIGHSTTLSEKVSKSIWDIYYPIFIDILNKMDFATEYPMFLSDFENTYRLSTTKIHIINTHNSKNNNDLAVWIEDKHRNKLNLFPFIICNENNNKLKYNEDSICIYESFGGKAIKFYTVGGDSVVIKDHIPEYLKNILKDKSKIKLYTPDEYNQTILTDIINKHNENTIELLVEENKVIEEIYVSRENIENKFYSWINTDKRIMFIYAEGGSGKTNIMAEANRIYDKLKIKNIFIRASRMNKISLLEEINHILNIYDKYRFTDYNIFTGNLREDPLIIILDGLNENENANSIWKEITNLTNLTEYANIKFIISYRANCKEDLNKLHTPANARTIMYYENENPSKIEDYCITLPAFDEKELRQAWDLYTNNEKWPYKPNISFESLKTLKQEILKEISNPFTLKLFLEIYSKQNLSNNEILNFWKNAIDPFSNKKIHNSKNINLWHDWFHQLIEEEKEFITILSYEIANQGKNFILLDDCLENTILLKYLTNQDEYGPYNTLLKKGIISKSYTDFNIVLSFTVESMLYYVPALNIFYTEKRDHFISNIGDVINGNYIQLNITEQIFTLLGTEESGIDLLVELNERKLIKPHIYLRGLKKYLLNYGTESFFKAFAKNNSVYSWSLYRIFLDYLNEWEFKDLRTELYGKLLDDEVEFKIENYDFLILLILAPTAYIGENSINLAKNKIETMVMLLEDFDELYNKCDWENIGDYQNLHLDFYLSCAKCYNHAQDYESAISILEACTGKNFENIKHFEKSNTFYDLLFKASIDLIKTYTSIKDYTKAINLIKIISSNEYYTDESLEYANFLITASNTYYKMGDWKTKFALERDAFNIKLKLLGEDNITVIDASIDFAFSYNTMGKFNAALDLGLQCLNNLERYLKNEIHPEMIEYRLERTYRLLAYTYNHLLEWVLFDTYINKLINLLIIRYTENSIKMAQALHELGISKMKRNEWKEAIDYIERSLSIYESSETKNKKEIARCFHNLGTCYMDGFDDIEIAYKKLTLSLKIRIGELGENHPDTADSLYVLSVAAHRLGKHEEAIRNIEQCTAIRIECLGGNHPQVAKCYYLMGQYLRVAGHNKKALNFLEIALEIYKSNYGEEHLDVQNVKEWINRYF